MNFSEFTQDAIRTESVVNASDVKINLDVVMNVLDLVAASGGLLDMIKKQYFYGKEINRESLNSLISTVDSSLGVLNLARSSLGTDLFKGKDTLPINTRIFHSIIGMSTETTEMIEALIKGIDSGTLDIINLMEECGDLDWYKAIGFDVTGLSEEGVRIKVIEKLRARYPKKFFDANDAINRNIDNERKILEA